MENQAQPIIEPQASIQSGQSPVQPVAEQFVPNEKRFSKWLLAFAGLVLLTILFSGVYFLGIYHGMNQNSASKTPIQTAVKPTPTPNPTANWKTYTNNNLGLTIKYPSDWTAPPDVLTKGANDGFSIGGGTFSSPEAVSYQKTHPQNMGVPSGYWIDFGTNSGKDLLATANNPIVPITIKSGQVGSYSVLTDVGMGPEGVFMISFKQGALYFILSHMEYQEEFNRNEEIFKNMLKTLTFTNQTSSPSNPNDETTNWKIYDNPNTKFTLKYPSSWAYMETENNLKLLPPGVTPVYANGPGPEDPFLNIATVKAIGTSIGSVKHEAIVLSGNQTDKYYETDTKGVIKAVQLPDGSLLSITFQLPQDNLTRGDVDAIINNIISTIKFK
jgi:hypothetical protein